MLELLPNRLSSKWFLITTLIFVFLLGVFISSRLILGVTIDLNNIIGFVIIAVISAILAGLGGYIGGKVYFIITIVSYLIGVCYMMYIVNTSASGDWSDITSIISFMSIAVCGIIAGLIIQVIWNISKSKSK